jgi:hypothetical protein
MHGPNHSNHSFWDRHIARFIEEQGRVVGRGAGRGGRGRGREDSHPMNETTVEQTNGRGASEEGSEVEQINRRGDGRSGRGRRGGRGTTVAVSKMTVAQLKTELARVHSIPDVNIDAMGSNKGVLKATEQLERVKRIAEGPSRGGGGRGRGCVPVQMANEQGGRGWQGGGSGAPVVVANPIVMTAPPPLVTGIDAEFGSQSELLEGREFDDGEEEGGRESGEGDGESEEEGESDNENEDRQGDY